VTSDVSYQSAYQHHLRDERTRASANAVADVLLDFVSPRSVIDLGCGVGTWLDVFRQRGAEQICGLDDESVFPQLVIDHDDFLPCDLTNPPSLNGDWDLALCLEVAEHLPPQAAAKFVGFLTRLSPLVLFSAAVPGQGGVGHLNEQWPDYWTNLFAAHAFIPLDVVRWRVWNNASVLPWYAQNTLLFARESHVSAHGVDSADCETSAPPGVVHPRLFERRIAALSQEPSAGLKTRLRRKCHKWARGVFGGEPRATSPEHK